MINRQQGLKKKPQDNKDGEQRGKQGGEHGGKMENVKRRRRGSRGGHAKVYVGGQRRMDHLVNNAIGMLDPLIWPRILGRRERQGTERRACDERKTSQFGHECFGAKRHLTRQRRSGCSAALLNSLPPQFSHLFLT